MKKKYINPTIECIHVEMAGSILAGVSGGIPNQGQGGDGGGAKPFTGNVWNEGPTNRIVNGHFEK